MPVPIYGVDLYTICSRCGKTISDDEYVVNWGTCNVCFDDAYEAYLHSTHLRLQNKLEFELGE